MLFIMQSKTKASSLQKESSNQESRRQKEKSQQKAYKSRGKHIVTLGVCAMKKKVQSKPMKQILRRLRCKEIEIIEMWQYLEQHWSQWPKVDALICFHSDGFPFLMAWRYVQKHKPFLINSLDKQQLLWDRTVVYDILKRIKVPVAKHYFIFRNHDYLEQIEQRGNGKSVPDPPNWEKEREKEKEKEKAVTAEKAKIKQRASMNEPMALSFSGFGSSVGGSAGKETATEGFITYQANTIKQETQQQVKCNLSEVNYRKSQLKQQMEKANKLKPRFSGDPSCSSDSPTRKNYPSCLRNFCESRHPDHFKYQVEQSEDADTILIKCGDQVQKLKKPFVEKPFDSQNHQICIYYPQSMGGGRKKLFRKVKDCSSNYQTNENSIRTEGNYIYEEFLPTNAFDIKVYTIGPYYMYAEARRSPTLDGVVQRNEDGKEIRFPVILSPDEKFICNRIVQEFEQEVCGFDLLRANGKSYVCDVNGWSFVKGNPKYWDDCATILTKKIFGHFFPDQIRDYPMYDQSSQHDFRLPMDNLKPKVEELRSIVSIFRHGDRSPKLKLKIKTSDPRFIEFFVGVTKDEIKFKDAKNLTKILEICNNIIAELDNADPLIKDYLQMKLVLEEGGHFEGFTRKLQLKVVDRSEKEGTGTGKGAIKKVMIVLKWGGELSYFGYQDAIELGKKMRIERYDDHDCLSLYSQYRHDLKTYSSDEGRCIKTAAAFLKGFLSIEGELAPIISSMVKADPKAQRLLDCTSSQNHSLLADELQVRLTEIMNREEELLTSYLQYRGEEFISETMHKTIMAIGRPREMLRKLYDLIKELVFEIERIYLENWQQDGLHERISHHQQLDDELKCQDIVLVSGRWSKIKKDFYDSQTKKFNISKVPEIYDTIRHDFRKNGLIFNLVDQGIKDALFQTAETLAYFVVINEYGITDKERIKVAQDICLPLFEKILIDLMFWKGRNEDGKYWHYKEEEEMTAERAIRTRLYFTSASHIYSLINLLTLGNNRYLLSKTPEKQARDALNVNYLGYLSHLEFRLYENLVMSHNDPGRFRLEISFSTEYKKTKKMKEFSLGGHGFNINEISQFIESLLSERKVETLARDAQERTEKRKHSD